MTLDDLLQQGWMDHAAKTEEVADRLDQGIDLVEDGAGAARYMSLVSHAMGDHLGQRERATTLCERVVAKLGSDAGADAQVYLAVARRLSGDDEGANAAQEAAGAEDPALGVRIGLLVAQGHMHAGAWTDAASLYRAMLTTSQILDKGHSAERTVAVVSNNLASELLGLRERNAAQDGLMADSAKAAADYWGRVGTWVNKERGEYLLSMVHRAMGDSKSARLYAEKGLQTIEKAEGEERVDEAFLHLARAAACRDGGDGEAQSESLATAAALGATFEGEGLLAWFQKELEKAR